MSLAQLEFIKMKRELMETCLLPNQDARADAISEWFRKYIREFHSQLCTTDEQWNSVRDRKDYMKWQHEKLGHMIGEELVKTKVAYYEEEFKDELDERQGITRHKATVFVMTYNFEKKSE